MYRLNESISSPSSAHSPNKSFHPPLLPPMRNGTSIMTSISMLQVEHFTVSGFDDFCDVCTASTMSALLFEDCYARLAYEIGQGTPDSFPIFLRFSTTMGPSGIPSLRYRSILA